MEMRLVRTFSPESGNRLRASRCVVRDIKDLTSEPPWIGIVAGAHAALAVRAPPAGSAGNSSFRRNPRDTVSQDHDHDRKRSRAGICTVTFCAALKVPSFCGESSALPGEICTVGGTVTFPLSEAPSADCPRHCPKLVRMAFLSPVDLAQRKGEKRMLTGVHADPKVSLAAGHRFATPELTVAKIRRHSGPEMPSAGHIQDWALPLLATRYRCVPRCSFPRTISPQTRCSPGRRWNRRHRCAHASKRDRLCGVRHTRAGIIRERRLAMKCSDCFGSNTTPTEQLTPAATWPRQGNFCRDAESN